MKRIGVLTGGGDAPGLNAAIKAVVYKAADYGYEVIGLYDGWQGLLDGYSNEALRLERYVVRTWDREGGTKIGSSRTNPFLYKPKKVGEYDGAEKQVDRSDEILANFKRLGLAALVAMGGEDTLGVAAQMYAKGLPVVGVPKTIDGDLWNTDYTLGFSTAVDTCAEMIERLRTPAGSHKWVQVVEVMGRHTGHLALWAGVAGSAFMILIPEHPFDMRRVAERLRERISQGNLDRRYPRYAVVVVSEGAMPAGGELVTVEDGKDSFGHVKLGGIGELLSKRIRDEFGFDSRAVVLGYTQRGGPPNSVDRIAGAVFGAFAVDAVKREKFGTMVSARGIPPAGTLELVELKDIAGKIKTVDVERHYDTELYHLKR